MGNTGRLLDLLRAPRVAMGVGRSLRAAVVLATVQASCSWTTYFLIANRSGQQIQLQYTARRIPAFPAPFILPLKDLKSLGGPRAPAGALARRLDSLIEYTVTVPPDSAVAIFYASTYAGHPDGFDELFTGLRLSVRTSRGRMKYEGGEIPRAFKKLSRFAYTLDIE